MSSDDLDRASAAYDAAEESYLAALRTGAGDAELLALAAEVAAAARAWELRDIPEPKVAGISRYYDLPEVLSTLWADIAEAYRQRGP